MALAVIGPGIGYAAVAHEGVPAWLCIANRTHENLVLVVDTGEVRRVAPTAPGGVLCAHAPDGTAQGTVGVFETFEAIEGCNRLAKVGRLVPLLGYASFDNCRWGADEPIAFFP